MAMVIKRFVNFYISQLDLRVQDWFLLGNPLPVAGIVSAYLYFVLKWGPKFMEKRKPFNIDKILIIYNIVQIALCLFLVISGFDTIFNNYNWACAEITKDDHGLFVAKLVYVYFIIKIVDLLDTVFFVLRKKQNQVTFLHVYHHGGMVVLTWFGMMFVPGGHSVFMGYVNCIVHVVMYFYYLLTAYDKKFKYNVAFKRRITEMQLIQFFILLVWYSEIVFVKNCSYPLYASMVFVPQNLFMFVLFGDFYIKTYILKNKKKKDKKEALTITDDVVEAKEIEAVKDDKEAAKKFVSKTILSRTNQDKIKIT